MGPPFASRLDRRHSVLCTVPCGTRTWVPHRELDDGGVGELINVMAEYDSFVPDFREENPREVVRFAPRSAFRRVLGHGS